MLTKPTILFPGIFSKMGKYLVVVAIYSSLVLLLRDDLRYSLNEVAIVFQGMLITALSIFLAFRTNSAYERWWEARKIWGQVVNDSRTLIRQAITFIVMNNNEKQQAAIRTLAFRQIGWCWALNRSLRKQEVLGYIEEFIPKEEMNDYLERSNIPNAILEKQGHHLRNLFLGGTLDKFHLQAMDKTLSSLTDNMGRCERIKNTVFPPSYSRFTLILLYILNFSIPLSLVDDLGFWVIIINLVVGFIFYYIEVIGFYLEDPFENKPTDTAMSTISRTIEIDLKQMVMENSIPEKMEPGKRHRLLKVLAQTEIPGSFRFLTTVYSPTYIKSHEVAEQLSSSSHAIPKYDWISIVIDLNGNW